MKQFERQLDTLLIVAFVAIVAVVLTSCKATQFVPVETIKTETKFVTEHLHDTTIIRDSIFIKEKGDTIYIDRWHTRDRIVYTNKVDSFIRIDTIPQITEVRVPVRQRNGYDKLCSWFMWIVIVLTMLWIAWKLFKKYYLHI